MLYEGLAYQQGHLYLAAHGGGLRTYTVGADGVPSFASALVGGLGNPWKLDLDGGLAFVADNELGLAVLSLADPAAPEMLQMVPTTGSPVDVDATTERIYVAEGGFGVEVFDRDGANLTSVAQLETRGTAQAVAASPSQQVVAVAAWSHVALYHADNLALLGTETVRNYPLFEQDLGVAMADDRIYVGEWEGLHVLRYRQGRLAADLWTDTLLLQMPSDEPGVRALVVRNRGHLPLRVDDVVPDHASFAVDRPSFVIAPGEADFFEVTFTPPGPDTGKGILRLFSNDPDVPEKRLGLIVSESDRINVGDSIDEDFAFLDPSGAGQLAGLDGHVIVLAYFALF